MSTLPMHDKLKGVDVHVDGNGVVIGITLHRDSWSPKILKPCPHCKAAYWVSAIGDDQGIPPECATAISNRWAAMVYAGVYPEGCDK